jgi:imidazolonepropionase-like amidohydrolase
VNIVDGTSTDVRPDRTVIVRGNRIELEGPASSTRAPAGARVIDGRGKYLIPGLWDVHVHTVVPAGDQVLPLYVANGVTGIRDMAGELDQLVKWRSEISAGIRVGPRMVISGPAMCRLRICWCARPRMRSRQSTRSFDLASTSSRCTVN